MWPLVGLHIAGHVAGQAVYQMGRVREAVRFVSMFEAGLVLNPTSLNEGLRVALTKAELTVEGLAEESGLSTSTLHYYLRPVERGGRVPEARDLRAITRVLARHLGVTPGELWYTFGELLDATPPAPGRTATSGDGLPVSK